MFGESSPTKRIYSGIQHGDISPDDAAEQLLQYKESEYQRYVAARAVRAIKESDDEKPSSGTLRQLRRQAGGQEGWRHSWPALLRAVTPPRDPELPDELQSPLPPHSRWLLATRSNVLFNVFNRSTNPVEDFYLIPLDDVWRRHRYGVYGLHYQNYPNPGTMAVPRDGNGLYYRPNRKILENTEGARPLRRPGLVTLEHVKRVASRAVGQFFPCVHKDPAFFDSWPRIDEVLGCAIEYFHHYFELRRLEETMVQLECRLFDSSQLDRRRHRMEECVRELGQIYSTYLLGSGLAFHHLQQGAGYKSAVASDRQIFEALNAFVAQCVWIAYRRPNVTVIARELGRLFRTTGFDASRRAAPPCLDHMTSARTLAAPGKSTGGMTSAGSKQGRGNSTGRNSMSERRHALGGSMSGSARHGQSAAASRKSAGADAGGRRTSSDRPESSRPLDASAPHTSWRRVPDSGRSASGQPVNSPAPHVSSRRISGTSDSGLHLSSRQTSDRSSTFSTSTAGGARNVRSGASEDSKDMKTSRSVPGDSSELSLGLSVESVKVAGNDSPLSETGRQMSSTGASEPPPQSIPSGGDGGVEGNSEPSADDVASPPSIHVSMKKVYGLYTGPPPPQCAIYALLRNNSPALLQSLSRRAPDVTAEHSKSLIVDRNNVGILGTPLKNYDDVLAAIDYEREEKQKKLQFLGPGSIRAGVSRVIGVVPYLLLPSKFFSPDA